MKNSTEKPLKLVNNHTGYGDSLAKALPKDQQIIAPIYSHYIDPLGALDNHVETHALFHYYAHARLTYETYVLKTPIVLEGEADPEYNFKSLFISIARMYNVHPENMLNAWDKVEKQILMLNLPPLPQKYKTP